MPMKDRQWALSWESDFILFFYLRPRFPSCFFPSGFHIKILYAFLSPMRNTYPSLPINYFITLIIFSEENMAWRCSLCNFLHYLNTSTHTDPNIFLSSLSQTFSINTVMKSSTTTTQENRRNYVSVYLVSVFTDRFISCHFRNYRYQIIAVCMLYALLEELF
jgi:hypothetical protein